MQQIDLGSFLSGQIFVFMLTLTRIGGMLTNFPGLGESFVPMNVRLAFALIVSFLLFPVLSPLIGAMPQQIPALALLFGKELLIGLFFGFILRALMGVLEVAGAVVALETGLSNAMILNPTMGAQSALPSVLYSLGGTALIFITGLDHFLLTGMLDTYKVFPVRGTLILGDMTQTYAHLVSDTFRVGVELSAPLMIIGLLLYVVLGIIQRMMAQIQLFLVVMPLQIWGGLLFFAASIGIAMQVWLRYFDRTVGNLLLR